MSKEAAKSVWGASPAGSTYSEGAEPGTKEFFENVIKKRSAYEMPWLFELVPFDSFTGKGVLELGCGAGYDAYEICRNGANYTGIDLTPENIDRTKKHLSYYGFNPYVVEGDAEKLQFADESFDVVFSNGVLHHTPEIEKSFLEANRVLRDEGEFWVILYHKNSIFYWISQFFVKHIMNRGYKEMSFSKRLSLIEYTTSEEIPIVNVYTRGQLKKLLEKSGFTVESIRVRKLLREDLPIIHRVDALWRFIPQPLLDLVGKRFGWYVITKARKR